MPGQPLNILEFIRHPKLLNDQTLSVAQQTVLKATYGLSLNDEESEIYQRATGRSEAVSSEQHEATLIAGRRSGKTSKIATSIALYEAFREHNISPGDRGYVTLIAPVKDQAAIAMGYIRARLQSSPILRKFIVRVRQDEIELSNNISIVCCACSYITIRGISVVCGICDEVGFWPHKETAANPEEEVLAALRPAMATFPTAKLVKISTPYRKEGILWREFQQRAELDHLVWQLPTTDMNPAIDPSILDEERKRDDHNFRREFLAEFADNIAGWVDPEVLDSCVVRNRTELPHVEHAEYVVAIDPAFKGSDFALTVLHRTADGPVVVDRVEHWTGTKKVPLAYEQVCEKISEIVKQYGIRTVLGDQYCAAIIKQYFDKLGIRYVERTFGTNTRAELFGNLRHLLTQRKIEVLDKPILLSQLRALEEHNAPSGHVDIRPPYGHKDDVAVATALAAFELAKRPPRREPMIEVIQIFRPYTSSFGRARHVEPGGWIRVEQA